MTCIKDFEKAFNVAIDKGTFDAISLSPVDKKASMEKYVENVSKMLKENGYLFITSCNWTGDELKVHFQNYFTFVEKLPTPSFSFGGKTGSTVSTLLFKVGKS